MKVFLRWLLVPLFFGLGVMTLAMKGVCLSGVVELLISAVLFGLSFVTKTAFTELADLASDAASAAGGAVATGSAKAAPHIGHAAQATAQSGAKVANAIWEGFCADAVFWTGVLAGCVATYLFGSAYIQHNWQHFHLGMFVTSFSLFCLATKYDWWDNITRNCIDDKKGRVWTWLFISLVGLALAFIHKWLDVGVIFFVSSLAAGITLLEWWDDTWNLFKKVTEPWWFKHGWVAAALIWGLTLFVCLIAYPIARGQQVGSSETYLLYAVIIVGIVLGIPKLMQRIK